MSLRALSLIFINPEYLLLHALHGSNDFSATLFIIIAVRKFSGAGG